MSSQSAITVYACSEYVVSIEETVAGEGDEVAIIPPVSGG